ncbi:MAG: lipase family alpha/beta hydrolase [Pirellulales bacterium]
MCVLFAGQLSAAEPPAAGANLPLRTMGGKQYWADVQAFHEWRIQWGTLSKHYRLLDGENVRHAWGSLAACRRKLSQIRRERNIPPMQGEAVIVLHGMMRSSACMQDFADYLHREGGYSTFAITYPTAQGDLAEHAQYLASVIRNLHGIERIHLVGHSMGSLVIRHYLADETDEELGRTPDARIARIVMLGPPNHGSPLADAWAGNFLYDTLLGPAATQLAVGPDEMGDQLAVPAGEFGIIAGGRGDGKGWNPALSGDDDGTVPVASTRLPGATDFIVLPVMHTAMIKDESTMECTLRFLQHGYFRTDTDR